MAMFSQIVKSEYANIFQKSEKVLKQQSLVRKINDKKEQLFSQFSTPLTKDIKTSSWAEIKDLVVFCQKKTILMYEMLHGQI